jgi:glycosyltransferase involved in cell wall biosynthesis
MHGLYTRLWDTHGFGSARATELLVRKIEDYNPDIIQLHNIHGYYLNIEVLFEYLARSGKPVAWTLHDCWAFTGHCSYFDYAGCDKWKTGCFDCPQKGDYPASLLRDGSSWNYKKKKELFTSVRMMRLIAPSHWLAGLVGQSFLSRYPIHVIPNGIDLEAFRPTLGGLPLPNVPEGTRVLLGVAGTWDRRKGLDYLLRLARDLGPGVRVALLGLSDAQRNNLPENVLDLGRTSDVRRLAQIYTAADAFVNPTLEDNFPTTNLEALACGTPIVTFATGGSVESVDETCGRIVPKGDTEALKCAVMEMEKVPEVSRICRQRALLYDEKVRFAQYLLLYDSMLKASEKTN